MKTCIICGCTDAAGCIESVSGDPCHWADPIAPACSRCVNTAAALVAHLRRTPSTVADLFAPIPPEEAQEAACVLVYAAELGAVVFEGELLVVREIPPPPHHVGTIDGCEVWSLGTFTVGEGWGPLSGPMGAALEASVAPSIVVPFVPETKVKS